MSRLRAGAAKGALKDLEAAGDARDLVAGDRRFGQAQAIKRQQDEGREIVHEVFAGLPIADNPDRIREILGARSVIFENWGKASTAFLAIGRTLLNLRETLSSEEDRALRRGASRLFPFSDSMVSKLVEIARAVREGRIPEPQLPAAYSTAYDLAKVLRDERGLRLATERNLIRNDVQRVEVEALKRDLRDGRRLGGRIIDVTAEEEAEEGGVVPNSRVSLDALRARQADLRRQRDEAAARLADLDRYLIEVTEQVRIAEGGVEE